MKKEYQLYAFAATMAILLILVFAFQFSYEHARLKSLEHRQLQFSKELSDAQSSPVSKQESGFYLKEEGGWVVVYRKGTLYDYTSIPVASLPTSLQEEVRSGKYMTSEKELYGFLENYSS